MASRRWNALAAVIALAAVTGCDAVSSADEADRPTAAVAASPAGSVAGGTPDLDAGEVMAQGIDVPWGLTFLPGGDALIGERDTGRVLRLTPGSGTARQVFQVPGVAAVGEGGMLGLAASPDFARDGLVYVYFTAERDNRIGRFRLDGGGLNVVFDGIARASYHNGGRIAFGPDGLLYVGTGDAGDTSASQDPASPNGKILRLTRDGTPAPGNPQPAHRSTASATATCRAWPGTRKAGCSPPSSDRTTSTR